MLICGELVDIRYTKFHKFSQLNNLEMCSFKIGDRSVSDLSDSIYIIAEIGQNHQGSINIAKQLILEAKRVGCNCVKFQKSCLCAKFTRSALNRKYDGPHSWGSIYGEHKEFLEFSLEQYKELQEFSNKQQIHFTASAMDEISLMQLQEMNLPFIKIGSGDANNFPMLKKAAKMTCPLLISTGMQTMGTIETIVEIMRTAHKTNYALLHCVSSYPTEPKDCNLQLILLLKQKFPNVVVGYSGHEEGIDITKAAILLGARIVERHFTLDKSQKGSDHKCSLTPDELQKLVDSVREFEMNGLLKRVPLDIGFIKTYFNNSKDIDMSLAPIDKKTILPCEMKCRDKLGKSIVTTRELKKGHLLQERDLCVKVSEPNGVPAENFELLLGKELNYDLIKDSPIQLNDIH